jgi:4-aminobutyrate aminotransferase
MSTANLSSVWSHLSDIVVESGEGAFVSDARGRRYLDFTSGIGVTNTGHCHPRVVAAAQAQVAKLIHGQINVVLHGPMLALVEKLRRVVPPSLNTLFFANSGAEAIEAALKLARRATGRPNIIVFQGGFHGRTIGAMSLTTSKVIVRAGYQPLMAGVAVAPYPYTYRYGWTSEETSAFCLRELRHLLATQTAPEETAAILVEPVLGEGGYVVPPLSFLSGVEEICREAGLLLLLDEIQTGFGRTGRFFGLEHAGLRPDILIMAKGLASGFPLSAVAASRDLMDRWPTGAHGGTYGGNAVACAAAAATIDVIVEEGLVERAADMGVALLERLRRLQPRHGALGEVRGLGLMVAAEFSRGLDRTPDKAMAKAVQSACLEQGLLLLTCGTHDHVVRFIPPLVVTAAQIDEAVGIFEKALQSAEAARPA